MNGKSSGRKKRKRTKRMARGASLTLKVKNVCMYATIQISLFIYSFSRLHCFIFSKVPTKSSEGG